MFFVFVFGVSVCAVLAASPAGGRAEADCRWGDDDVGRVRGRRQLRQRRVAARGSGGQCARVVLRQAEWGWVYLSWRWHWRWHHRTYPGPAQKRGCIVRATKLAQQCWPPLMETSALTALLNLALLRNYSGGKAVVARGKHHVQLDGGLVLHRAAPGRAPLPPPRPRHPRRPALRRHGATAPQRRVPMKAKRRAGLYTHGRPRIDAVWRYAGFGDVLKLSPFLKLIFEFGDGGEPPRWQVCVRRVAVGCIHTRNQIGVLQVSSGGK